MFIMSKYLLHLLLTLSLSSSSFNAQQPYSGEQVEECNNYNETGAPPSFLYTCNTPKPSCKAFLMFKTKPPYLSLSSISNLTSADSVGLARTNIISSSALLPPDNEVIVPVTCSCTGGHYQANTTYVILSDDDTYFTIANNVYQGLTSCDDLIRRNTYGVYSLRAGLKLEVPLRCACPTQEQIGNGTKFLLTYLIDWGDTVSKISERFNVSSESVAVANGFSDKDPMIYALTTILIPLSTQPVRYQMRKKSSQHKQKKSYKGLYIGAGTGAALSLLCFLLVIGFLYNRRERKTEASWREQLPENFLDKVVDIGETLKIYRYDELEEATNNFSPHKRLSSSIYTGNLRGKLLAIKKMSTDISKEIKILGNVNHFNLISLYGFCDHDGVFYLVYEYMEEGSLKKWLSSEDCAVYLTWAHRVVIALDVANGLNYLHNFTAPAYVHKDINSSNILLNRDLRAKIANFSLARENGNSDTSCVEGVKGYVAPEYMQAGVFTPKVDVYAFGVVLLELITGREAVFLRDGEEVLLSETVISAIDGSGEINELIDPRLQVKHPLGYVIDHTEFALCLLKLSVACLARDPASRLSMAEAVSALMKIQLDIYNPQSFSIE
ncbi:hypothetical protein ACS0TY_028627 [Phlomoides rotata]